jgi:ABC-type Na+ efflux pump permease subunit
MGREHIFVAKIVIAAIFGVLLGYGMAVSTKADAARAKELTMKQYVADFDSYKAKLEGNQMPMGIAVVVGVLMVLAMFGIYEALAFGLGKVLALITRGSTAQPPGGPPPPWGVDRR